jgi:hypothetical protein
MIAAACMSYIMTLLLLLLLTSNWVVLLPGVQGSRWTVLPGACCWPVWACCCVFGSIRDRDSILMSCRCRPRCAGGTCTRKGS